VSKKLQEKQRKRLADQMRRDQQRKAARRSNMITIGIAVVIIAAVTVFIINERSAETEAAAAPEGVPADEAGCDPVEEHEEEGNQHVDPNQEVQYETSPPTSGDHWPPELVADADFYPDTVPEESLVHNLEHGQIVIWYDADASTEVTDNLEEFTDSQNDPDALPAGATTPPIVSVPYDDVPEGKSYVMTAWTQSQACSSYSLEAINEFRERFQGRSPEPIAPTFEDESA
jgi:hypothetical protein